MMPHLNQSYFMSPLPSAKHLKTTSLPNLRESSEPRSWTVASSPIPKKEKIIKFIQVPYDKSKS